MKKLCKLRGKKVAEVKKYILSVSNEPKFICRKCLRLSNTKAVLCKGEAL